MRSAAFLIMKFKVQMSLVIASSKIVKNFQSLFSLSPGPEAKNNNFTGNNWLKYRKIKIRKYIDYASKSHSN